MADIFKDNIMRKITLSEFLKHSVSIEQIREFSNIAITDAYKQQSIGCAFLGCAFLFIMDNDTGEIIYSYRYTYNGIENHLVFVLTDMLTHKEIVKCSWENVTNPYKYEYKFNNIAYTLMSETQTKMYEDNILKN